MAALPSFSKASKEQRYGRSPSTVHTHRIVRSLIYLLAWIFLLLVCIGGLANKPVLRNTFFLKLNLANIIPLSVPNALLINSIARSIGLHDFYQVGLWSFCEGYMDTGITYCSKPVTLYWFNPVAILLDELLSGATIVLPGDINHALAIARLASHWMFGLFLTATVLTFVLVLLSPLAVSSRPPQSISADPATNDLHPVHRRRTFVLLRSFPFLLLTFVNALFTIVASVVATVMFTIFQNVFTNDNYNLNIEAEVGTRMMAFMWIASGFNLLAFLIQFGSCCCSCCGGRKARKQLKAAAAAAPGAGGTVATGQAGEMRNQEKTSRSHSPTTTGS